ncbi:DUF2971 domain-containing protein [Lacticaseibacillus paracasei]|uniref:DUF2971 domain-containing protein n=1 Tax=Lacticaseibacillus paracasei TaxID=1597 RepID=UPI0019570B4D|nr:DUF2971 domain-containing protein [Lacticaseibacillus paracasei]
MFLNKSLKAAKEESKKKNGIFYQYTSAETLSKICRLDRVIEGPEKFSLRLYDERYMNDPQEGMVFIKTIFKDNYNAYIQQKEWSSALKDRDVFVASLTAENPIESENTIPLWGTYGKNHTGIAIGVEITNPPANPPVKRIQNELKDDSSQNEPIDMIRITPNLYKVFYDGSDNEEIGSTVNEIRNNIKKLFDAKTFERKSKKRNTKRIIDKIREAIQKVQFLYKKNYYSYENEFRIIKEVKHNRALYEKNDPRLFVTLGKTDPNVQLKEIIYGANFGNPYLWEPIIERNLGENVKWLSTKIKYR